MVLGVRSSYALPAAGRGFVNRPAVRSELGRVHGQLGGGLHPPVLSEIFNGGALSRLHRQTLLNQLPHLCKNRNATQPYSHSRQQTFLLQPLEHSPHYETNKSAKTDWHFEELVSGQKRRVVRCGERIAKRSRPKYPDLFMKLNRFILGPTAFDRPLLRKVALQCSK